jgi:hypothetical protein
MSTNIINGGLAAVIGQTQKVLLVDSSGNAIESLTSNGVNSINGVTGTVTIAGAGDVSVTTAGTTITVSGSGFGNVSGPSSSTDMALAIYSGTAGTQLSNSDWTLNTSTKRLTLPSGAIIGTNTGVGGGDPFTLSSVGSTTSSILSIENGNTYLLASTAGAAGTVKVSNGGASLETNISGPGLHSLNVNSAGVMVSGSSTNVLYPWDSGTASLGTVANPWGAIRSNIIVGNAYSGGTFNGTTISGSVIVGGSFTGTTFSGTTFIGDTSIINYVIDGGGGVIASGSAGFVEVPWNVTPVSWDLLSNISGSLSVDVRRSTYATWTGSTFISGNASIVGSEKPTITNGFKGQDASLTTWSGISAGDILVFHVDQTPTLITRATLALKVRKTS